MTKPVLIVFGGLSPEHEVSIITGLQVLESIDRNQYRPIVIYIDKHGAIFCLPNLRDRHGFLTATRKLITFGRNAKGGFIRTNGMFGKKMYPYAAYLALHGGPGESGPVQGFFEVTGVPFTSASQESSVLMMNKQLTKQVVSGVGVEVVPGISMRSSEIRAGADRCAKNTASKLGLPVIVKPVHLGSSIGIAVARTEVELEKALLEAAFIDTEILVEKFLPSFVEYNCAVRSVSGKLEASEVERPLSKDEILSFADKYERGGKKTGGDSGMASLSRELPAKIDADLKHLIQETAKKAFLACRTKGMVRADFMYTADKNLYLTEINPIPGSMAFYLWEASGISFTQQISDLIEGALYDKEHDPMPLEYKTAIVEKFVSQ